MANLMEGSDLGDFYDNSILGLLNDELFFTEEPSLKNNFNDDPILTTLSCKTNNVLDIVDLPQSPLDLLSTQKSPDNCNVITSPWHESDSGISDNMSVWQSPEHIYDHQMQLQSATNEVRPSMTNTAAEDMIDRELAAYLNGHSDNEIHSDDSPSAQSGSDFEDMPFFTQSLEQEEPIVNILSDDEFPSNNGNSSRTVQHGVKGDSKKAAHIGPSEVKILKVVRPSNYSEGVTSEDIAKAMDDRSKKNAVQAKLNREKKKAYIQSLEAEVEGLKSSNAVLKSENSLMKQDIADKDEEIDYLKSVLANASALSSLLKNISDVKEVKLSATIMTRKRVASDDHSYNLVENAPQKRARLIDENLKKAGVCLHVKGGTACLEFCAHCSKLAQKSYASS